MNNFTFLNRILGSLIMLSLGVSFLFAENDINKLSQEDRQQCEKMNTLVNKYAREKYNWQDPIVRKDGYEFVKTTVGEHFIHPVLNYKKKIKIVYDAYEVPSSCYIIKKDKKIIGISEIIPDFHGGNFSFDRYNKGYLISLVDYYGQDVVYNDSMLLEPSIAKRIYGKDYKEKYIKSLNTGWFKNLTFVIFSKKKYNIDMSYIKINNCFVEDYYLKEQE